VLLDSGVFRGFSGYSASYGPEDVKSREKIRLQKQTAEGMREWEEADGMREGAWSI